MNIFGRLRRSATSAAVLGCGPAGLFAAHALIEKGWDVTIISNKRRSEMFGAQYLHRPIPGLTNKGPVTVHYRLVGTVEGYREKVYGRRSGISVSPEELDESHSAYDIRQAYYNAWDMYQERIVHLRRITPQVVQGMINGTDFDRVISTIPAPQLCADDTHSFDSQEVWAIGDAPERGIWCPVPDARNFEIICNGDPDIGWYRTARVFGYRTAEWAAKRPPFEGVAAVKKPISNNCDCLPEVVRLGRYGEWRKGVLSHEAYEKAAAL